MTVKQRASVMKSSSSPEVAQKLIDIEQQLIRSNRFVDALTALMQIASDNLKDAQVWLLVGLVYTRMAHWQHAIGVLETALQLDPNNNQAKQLMSLALFSIGQKEAACQLIDKVCKSGSATGPQWMLRAYLHQHTSSDPMHSLAVARDWGKRFADPFTKAAKLIKVKDLNPRKILKIGYVTADFREHSVAFFMQPVLAHHNPENVEVHVYSNGPSDAVTEQMRTLTPYWHDIQSLSDEQLYAQVRAEGIDVLVDLSGFTHGHRLGVFARRAVPVQVTWLGYMHTLGMKAMDYRLVDAAIAPPSHAAYYSEKLFQLTCMASYVPPLYSPLCDEPPMLRNGYPTLVSLNSSGKITDAMLCVWAKILHVREDARLIIMVKEDSADAAQAHMQPRVEAAGMPLERVSVMHQQPLNQFMEMGHIADLALDTSPVSGGTTTLHALWMGLYVIALDAERGVDASSARILQGLGIGHCVAATEDAYVERVLAFLNDPDELKKWRMLGREHIKATSLMDYTARTAELEKAYRLMWLNWLTGRCNTLNVTDDLDTYLAEMDAAV
ncbi:MAG: glycosyltransferase [Comamonas sp.]|nr:glycosyltransferase [Comamonas sp.]